MAKLLLNNVIFVYLLFVLTFDPSTAQTVRTTMLKTLLKLSLGEK